MLYKYVRLLKNRNRHLSKKRALILIIALGIIGSLYVVATNAAPNSTSIEPESGTPSSGITTITNDATASGNSYIRFGSSSGNPPVTTGEKCSLGLHGAGGGGASYGPSEGVLAVDPQARNPANGSNTNKWLYDGPDNFQYDPDSVQDEQYYQYLTNYIRQTLDSRGCGPTLITGSSSGGGFAAKLYCRGEDFGGRVWGYFMNDPVMDEGVLNCRPSQNIRISFFTHSAELRDKANANGPNFRCNTAAVDWWYCENDKTMSLTSYQQQTGQQSLLTARLHYSTDHSNWLYPQFHSSGAPNGHRYDGLPWKFPAELWRTCYVGGSCSRQAFLP